MSDEVDAVVFETPRLLLRDFRDDDAEKIAEYFSEPQARPHLLRRQRGPGQWCEHVKRVARHARAVPLTSRGGLWLAMALRDTGELIGMCTLGRIAPGSPRAQIGWHLSNQFSGFGYATEAGRELIRFAFEDRGVACVCADCFESNAANLRVFAKLGMRPVRWLSLLKWLLALSYLEPRPIVRYCIEKESFGSGVHEEERPNVGKSTD